jgi:uncharacterized protein with PIN domain
VPPTRFIADNSLEHLARRLRFLGFDVASVRGARLEELFEAAMREGRTVLTPSVRHPRKFAGVPAVRVPREDPAAAARALLAGHERSGPPFSRCGLCNYPLQRRHALEARGEVPGPVLRTPNAALTHCPNCGKWYWEGSHVAKLREWMSASAGLAPEPRAPESNSTGETPGEASAGSR